MCTNNLCALISARLNSSQKSPGGGVLKRKMCSLCASMQL